MSEKIMSARETAKRICEDFEPETMAHIVGGYGKQLYIEDGIRMAMETQAKLYEGHIDQMSNALKNCRATLMLCKHKENQMPFSAQYFNKSFELADQALANLAEFRKKVGE